MNRFKFKSNGLTQLLLLVGAMSVSGVALGQRWPEYEYGGEVFDQFVRESYQVVGKGAPKQYYAWMEKRLGEVSGRTWNQWINERRGELSAARDKVAERERITAELHRTLKRVIPKFSLDRGFEFAYTEQLGERQCFLQSVLMAGILQRIGIESGVVMVSRNPKGAISNLGHACNLVKLDESTMILADCSEPLPFVRHEGIFLRVESQNKFLNPKFVGNTFREVQLQDSGALVPVSKLRPLTIDYINSMFDYYRGERVPGGLMQAKSSPQSLLATVRFLERSVRRSPDNPLAVFQLARAYIRQDRLGQARLRLIHAQRLYARAGWLPDSVKQTLESVEKRLAEQAQSAQP